MRTEPSTSPAHTPQLIGLDWGTSSLRAYLLGNAGTCIARESGPFGILQVAAGGFDAVYLRMCAGWQREHGPLPILASGMIGSRQGWLEAPYVACPAAGARIAAHLASLTASDGTRIRLVPGLSCRSAEGIPDVMRGEETQLLGAIDAAGAALWVLPGTHSKWVRTRDQTIEGFATYMTGELYAALRGHSILGRLMPEDPQDDPAAFRRGVQYGLNAGADLPGKLFSARTLGLFGEIPATGLADYLSGLLLGAELRDALAQRTSTAAVGLIGDPALCARYATALEIAGVPARMDYANATPLGLWRVAALAGLV